MHLHLQCDAMHVMPAPVLCSHTLHNSFESSKKFSEKLRQDLSIKTDFRVYFLKIKVNFR